MQPAPGFIVGIPAMPWVMPYRLGVVLLRRAGDGTGRSVPETGSRPSA